MNIACLQENLKRGLAIVGHAVAGKSTLPVLANVLLATDDGRLKLAATNLDILITHWLGASIADEGAVTIPAKLLADVVGGMANDRITLDLDARTQTLHLSCKQSEANIKGIEADEFPQLPALPDTAPIATLAPATLRDAIDQVAFAAATEIARPVLTTVLMRFRGTTLTLAAVDGFRLAVRTLTLPTAVEQFTDVLVPATALAELARVLSAVAEDVSITVTANLGHIVFHTSTVEVVARLMEGRFPDFERIIPQQHATRVVLDRATCKNAIKLAAYFATAASNTVKLAVQTDGLSGRGTVTFAANASEVGDNHTTMEGAVEGDAGTIALNVTFLAEAVDACATALIVLELQTGQSPAVFTPFGNDGYTTLIMPMTVR